MATPTLAAAATFAIFSISTTLTTFEAVSIARLAVDRRTRNVLNHLVGNLCVKPNHQVTKDHFVDSAIVFDFGDREAVRLEIGQDVRPLLEVLHG